jgi:iron complex transport system ATP-binding protein
MDETPILEIRNLNKIYENGYHANKDVSFSLPSGKLVGLIGPNGCGKTTMMRSINKMHIPTSGDILIDGESVLPKTPTEVAKLVSNVPAEMTASFGLTVFETVMLGRYPYLQNMWWETEEDESLVEDVLKKFGVHHLQDRALNMLSSGEQQRVLIAKAYVQQPRLMLVDEPTSHLDMKYKLDVMEYLRAMVKTDMTILVAEHDISLMARYCDLCVIMKKGELVAIGDPKKVITPELIQDVYDVSATVGLDEEGDIYVLPKRYHKDGELGDSESL